MSGLSVGSDNSLFTEAAAGTTPLTPEVVPVTLAAENAPGEVLAAPEPVLGDVEQTLEIEDSGIGDEIDALDVPEGEQPPTDEAAPETAEPVDEAGMAAFSAQFEKYTGVALKDAMASYQETAQAAASAQTELKNLYQQVAIQQQRLDLQTAWASDPDIQQVVQEGTPLSAAVDQRLEQLRKVYSTLGETRQRRIDSLGSKGVLELWKIVNKKTNRSLPGVGTNATPSAGTSDLMKLSEINAMPEREFQTVGMKLLQSKQFINDLGI